jgi:hypothetical protein
MVLLVQLRSVILWLGQGHTSPSVRRHVVRVVPLLLAMLGACSQEQGAGFHATGYFSIGLNDGAFILAGKGYAVDQSGQPVEPVKTKVLIVFLLPNIDTSDILSDALRTTRTSTTTSYSYELSLRSGKSKRFLYTWDRQKHLLLVGPEQYSIAGGNVFTVTCDSEWRVQVEQSTQVVEYACPGGEFLQGSECLSKIRTLFPKNERLQRVKLVGEGN